jgi:transposase
MSKKNKSWSSEDKLAILKEHFIEGKSVADICEAKGLAPSLFYTWREALFKPKATADEKRNQRKEQLKIKALEDRLAKSEAKIALKNEVIADLLEAHTKVKKTLESGRFIVDGADCA